jgi:hypothetical protein
MQQYHKEDGVARYVEAHVRPLPRLEGSISHGARAVREVEFAEAENQRHAEAYVKAGQGREDFPSPLQPPTWQPPHGGLRDCVHACGLRSAIFTHSLQGASSITRVRALLWQERRTAPRQLRVEPRPARAPRLSRQRRAEDAVLCSKKFPDGGRRDCRQGVAQSVSQCSHCARFNPSFSLARSLSCSLSAREGGSTVDIARSSANSRLESSH